MAYLIWALWHIGMMAVILGLIIFAYNGIENPPRNDKK